MEIAALHSDHYTYVYKVGMNITLYTCRHAYIPVITPPVITPSVITPPGSLVLGTVPTETFVIAFNLVGDLSLMVVVLSQSSAALEN